MIRRWIVSLIVLSVPLWCLTRPAAAATLFDDFSTSPFAGNPPRWCERFHHVHWIDSSASSIDKSLIGVDGTCCEGLNQCGPCTPIAGVGGSCGNEDCSGSVPIDPDTSDWPNCRNLLLTAVGYAGDHRSATVAFGVPVQLSGFCDASCPGCIGDHVKVAVAAHPNCEATVEARVILKPGDPTKQALQIRSVTTPRVGYPECGSSVIEETSVIDVAATFTLVPSSTPRYELNLSVVRNSTMPATKLTANAELYDRGTATVVATAQRDDLTRPAWYNVEGQRFAIGGMYGPKPTGQVVYDDFEGKAVPVPLDPDHPQNPNGAPPVINPTVPVTVKDSTSFLYLPSDPNQPTSQTAYDDPNSYIDPAEIKLERAAMVRGTVRSRDGGPLAGISVTIKNHTELGRTHTRMSGEFEMAVNGGGALTVIFESDEFLPAERTVYVPWNDYASVGEVHLVARDIATPITMNAGTSQVAQGSVESDTDGTRQATLFFPANTTATVYPSGGGSFTLNSGAVQVRATEYTVGPNGPKAMPAELPANTAYTYAVELGIDEAGDNARVEFNQDVYFYVEHFLANLGFAFAQPEKVPAGFYDREQSTWVTAPNGHIIRLVSQTGGLANIDVTGDGLADPVEYTNLGVTSDERSRLASTYVTDGSVVLWRVPVRHFSAWDLNWGFGLPLGAAGPGAPPPDPHEPPPGPPPCSEGSQIKCTTQVLGESLKITGTPYRLHYTSDRVYGRAVGRQISIYFGSTAPGQIAEFRGVEIEVNVAGKDLPPIHLSSIPTTPYEFVAWDGTDGFDRQVNGTIPTTVRIGYTYQGVYQRMQDFGHHGNGTQITGSRTRQTATIWQNFELQLESWDARGEGLGGWTVSAHHSYDPVGKILRYGTGERRAYKSQSPTVQPVAVLSGAYDVVIAADGSTYVSHGGRVTKVAPNGAQTVIAGTSQGGFNGDDGTATLLRLGDVRALDLGPDGHLYLLDAGNHKVRKVFLHGSQAGQMTTVVARGNCTTTCSPGPSAEGVAAADARLSSPLGLAVGPDGSIYIADNGNRRLRRVGPDGIIRTITGTGTTGNPVANGPAWNSPVWDLKGVDISQEGEIYFLSSKFATGSGGDSRIMKIDETGTLRTIAGVSGQNCTDPCNHTDGALATQSPLLGLEGIGLKSDGTVFFVERRTWGAGAGYVYNVSPDGRLHRVAGQNTSGFTQGDGGPARIAVFNDIRGVDPAPNGDLVIASFGGAIRKVTEAALGLSTAGYSIASEGGEEVYRFDPTGRHERTVDALTGGDILVFGYDGNGRLSTITDRGGLVTTIHGPTFTGYPFTGSGSIEAPGHGSARDQFVLNSNGYLSSFTNPANEQTQLVYGSGGLLEELTTPRGHSYRFTYDGRGLLIRDADPEVIANNPGNPNAFFKSLTRSGETFSGFTVDLTTALGRVTRYIVEKLTDGSTQLTQRSPAGLEQVTVSGIDDSVIVTLPGAPGQQPVVKLTRGPDSRFGMQAPVPRRIEITNPATGTHAAITAFAEETRTATLDAQGLLTSSMQSVTINGDPARTFKRAYDYHVSAQTRTIKDTSPVGRTRTLSLDVHGRITQSQIEGLYPIAYSYDTAGRLSEVSQGPSGERKITLGYDSLHRLTSIAGPLPTPGIVEFLEFDGADRANLKRLPGSTGPRDVLLTYDATGNLTAIVPPGRTPPAPTPQPHNYTYSRVNLQREYAPPQPAPTLVDPATYQYNDDRQLSSETRPDGGVVDIAYDSAGRLASVALPGANGEFVYAYSTATGRLESITGPADGPNPPVLSYERSGFLPTVETWTCQNPSPACPAGVPMGSVSRTFDSSLRLWKERVNGTSESTFTYDNDNLLTHVAIGPETLSIVRDAQKGGAIVSTTLGIVTDTRMYNGFGELDSYVAVAGSIPLYSVTYDRRDTLGRIEQKSESIGGAASTIYEYSYDVAGRLISVIKDGEAPRIYAYDQNGNRIAAPNLAGVASYDAQDRLNAYGAIAFDYSAAGEMTLQSDVSGVTAFTHDALGNLRAVTLPGPVEVHYTIDGQQRRVARATTSRTTYFLYDSQSRVIAEIDGASGMIVSRYLYARQGGAPVMMVSGGVPFRLIVDHNESIRLVVNAQTGAIVQQIDYDEFGVATLVAGTWEVQPFGFAGGLYDPMTGLTHFGRREYLASFGRWTTKEPLRFEGGLNAYAYAANDPVNVSDPSGLAPLRNNTGVPIPYKPEDQDHVIRLAPPGGSVDADGVYSPNGTKNPTVVKIPNGSSAELSPDGSVVVAVGVLEGLDKAFGWFDGKATPRTVGPADLAPGGREYGWPNPYNPNEPQGWPFAPWPLPPTGGGSVNGGSGAGGEQCMCEAAETNVCE